MGVVNLGVGMGGSIRIFVPDTYPKVSLRLRVPPKGQGYPVGMPRSQNVLRRSRAPGRSYFLFFRLFFLLPFAPKKFLMVFLPAILRRFACPPSVGCSLVCSRRSYSCRCSSFRFRHSLRHRRVRIHASENRKYCILSSGHPSASLSCSYRLRGKQPTSHRSDSAPNHTSTHTCSMICRPHLIKHFLPCTSSASESGIESAVSTLRAVWFASAGVSLAHAIKSAILTRISPLNRANTCAVASSTCSPPSRIRLGVIALLYWSAVAM